MSGASDSGDSADTFWPGYVDAISNLAINLLFVIAVMAIVVIGSTLQLSELMKKKDTAQGEGVAVSAIKVEDNNPGPGSTNEKKSVASDSAAADTAKKLLEQEQTIRQQADHIRLLQSQLQAVTISAAGKLDGAIPDLHLPQGKTEAVAARTPIAMPDGPNTSNAVQGGVIVNFDKDVIELTKEEMADLVVKLKNFGVLGVSGKWHITVFVPKGFSEATRLGFYRANVVRNLMLQNGVKGENIDLKVMESDRSEANSARVIVRPA